MAYVKQTWENLPSTNTPITAERLNHMEDGIDEAWQHGEGGAGETLPVGSEIEFTGQVADIPEGWEYSEDDYNVYSTDEKRIGTWIDGKPLYRKVLTGTTTTKNDGFYVSLTALNFDTIMIDGKSFVRSENAGSNTFITPANCPPHTSENYSSRPVRSVIIGDNIMVYIGSYNGYNAYDYVFIVEYTKTTDTV